MLSPDPMSFKPNPAPGTCPTLSGFGLLRVAGRDAAAFLQAQSMNDVNALAPARWQWNGLLTPKGRLIALFALLREADDQFLLVLPDVAAADLAALRYSAWHSASFSDAASRPSATALMQRARCALPGEKRTSQPSSQPGLPEGHPPTAGRRPSGQSGAARIAPAPLSPRCRRRRALP